MAEWPKLRICQGGGSVGTVYWVRREPGVNPTNETYLPASALQEMVEKLEQEAAECESWAANQPQESDAFKAQRDGYLDSARRLRSLLDPVTTQEGAGEEDHACGWCKGEGAITDPTGKLGADCPRCKGRTWLIGPGDPLADPPDSATQKGVG